MRFDDVPAAVASGLKSKADDWRSIDTISCKPRLNTSELVDTCFQWWLWRVGVMVCVGQWEGSWREWVTRRHHRHRRYWSSTNATTAAARVTTDRRDRVRFLGQQRQQLAFRSEFIPCVSWASGAAVAAGTALPNEHSDGQHWPLRLCSAACWSEHRTWAYRICVRVNCAAAPAFQVKPLSPHIFVCQHYYTRWLKTISMHCMRTLENWSILMFYRHAIR